MAYPCNDYEGYCIFSYGNVLPYDLRGFGVFIKPPWVKLYTKENGFSTFQFRDVRKRKTVYFI